MAGSDEASKHSQLQMGSHKSLFTGISIDQPSSKGTSQKKNRIDTLAILNACLAPSHSCRAQTEANSQKIPAQFLKASITQLPTASWTTRAS